MHQVDPSRDSVPTGDDDRLGAETFETPIDETPAPGPDDDNGWLEV